MDGKKVKATVGLALGVAAAIASQAATIQAFENNGCYTCASNGYCDVTRGGHWGATTCFDGNQGFPDGCLTAGDLCFVVN